MATIIFHQLLVLSWAALVTQASAASLSWADHSLALSVECGSSVATVPANISLHGGRHSGGGLNSLTTTLTTTLTTRGRARCQSVLQKKGPSLVHVITDVFRRDCGAKVSKDGRHYSINVLIQHRPWGQHQRQTETFHTLTCHYHTPATHTTHTHTHHLDLHKHQPDTTLANNTERNPDTRSRPKNGDIEGRPHVLPKPNNPDNPEVSKTRDNPEAPKTRNNIPEVSKTRDSPIGGFLTHLFPPAEHGYASRLQNDLDERLTVPENKVSPLHHHHHHHQPPSALALSKAPRRLGPPDVITDMTSSPPSVLQLNAVEVGGGMAGVVFPGKQLALELRTDHQSYVGTPVVTSCKVTNPLDPNSGGYNVATPPFSATLLHHGCGQGGLLPKSSRFTKSRQGFTTPYFPVPADWTHQTALIFSCDVTLCSDVMRCQQTCPPLRRKSISPGLHDYTVLLESQVVMSCPSVDDVSRAGDVRWDQSLLPECLPEGHSLHRPLQPAGGGGGVMIEPEHNITAGAAAGSDVNKDPSPSSSPSWLAGHLHYVIIMAILALLLFIFMAATFCKMAAMRRHVRREARKARGGGVGQGQGQGEAPHRGERAESGEQQQQQQDQTTQTPRPLPRTPTARGHNNNNNNNSNSNPTNRHSRQGGDGASLTVLHQDDGHVLPSSSPSSRPPSLGGVPPFPVFDNRRDSLPSPPPVPQQRSSTTSTSSSGKPRPQPYDIPPSHDQQQREFRTSVSSEPAQGGPPYVVESSQQRCSSKVKSFQSSTRVEEKNSERLTTIIQIQTPAGQRDSLDSVVGGGGGVAWSGGADHLATFTGGGGGGSSSATKNNTNSAGGGTLERGVVLGVNSLRRHLERENQQVPSQPRDRRPITAHHHHHHEHLPAAHDHDHDHHPHPHPLPPHLFYSTPAPCSEDSSLKELMLSSSPDGGMAAPQPPTTTTTTTTGIRTSPHRGSRKGGATPVVINTVEETTRL
ncbi:uncharacterized protein LOC143300237 [Babylonia areolata]|uniref:uncharacterized protein LOC143300237 n=1 Tax=Babylonia areolata TaxID=304850 RepID=UPI003FD14083